MKKIERVRVRLSKVHDYDLWCLYQTLGSVSFSHMIHEILICYVTQSEYKVPLITIWETPEVGIKERAKVFNVRIPVKYADKINTLLQNVHEGKRSAFIKTLMRTYLISILLNPFYENKKAEIDVSIKTEKFDSKKKENINTNNESKQDVSQGISSKVSYIDRSEKNEIQEHSAIQNDPSQNTSDIAYKKEHPEDDDGFNDLANLFGGFTVS